MERISSPSAVETEEAVYKAVLGSAKRVCPVGLPSQTSITGRQPNKGQTSITWGRSTVILLITTYLNTLDTGSKPGVASLIPSITEAKCEEDRWTH